MIPFSNTYDQVQKKADVIWRYRRYQIIKDYETRPIIPPPLTVLYLGYFVVQAFRCIIHRIDSQGKYKEASNSKPRNIVIELFMNACEI